MKLFDDADETHLVWRLRESGLGATARVPGKRDTWEGWEDASVPPAHLGRYLREFRALLDEFGYDAALYGHFGQGCVHTRIPFDLRSATGIADFRRFVERAADLVVRHGGSLSGEHGDGQSRAELLPRMFSPEVIRAFEELKDIWDPTNRMNPGKIVRPRRVDDDLRLGADYRRPTIPTHFAFAEDQGSFAYATERCVGVGECRRLDGGTMCPSYMVTREEEHSTRGRAHLLFEAMRGGLPGGMKSDAVREALDLCLACKGCKSECPVNVDVATYKAEFLSHYYEGRLRPRSAYLFGFIDVWARLGSLAPHLANAVLRQPTLARALKRVAGIAPERDMPLLAPTTFSAWWRARPAQGEGRPEVVLWVDTFDEHWQPSVLVAGVEVLEAAGYRVTVPARRLCCGRPLYDYGMLPRAKRLLREALDALRPAIRAGTPVVGLEPSCVTTLRDELVALFPDDADARALAKQTVTLDELLARGPAAWVAPRLARRALVHGHCHQKSVLGTKAHRAVLERVGVDAEILDAGCCGLAGGFGYEAGHLEVSVACGERRLLPAVRDAAPDTIVVADGFSCREQIRQLTDRRALHLAQVLRMALRDGPDGPRDDPPERDHAELDLRSARARPLAAAVAAAFAVAALVVLVAWSLA
jgi:Fe-S oxidoreductase